MQERILKVWQLISSSFLPTIKARFGINSQQPNPVQPGLTYLNFNTTIEDKPASIGVAERLGEIISPSTHGKLVELVIRLSAPDATGFASKPEQVEIENIRESFMKLLPGATLAGSITSGGIQSNFIYIFTDAAVPQAAKEFKTSKQFSFGEQADPTWKYYQELMPTIEESEDIVNTAQLYRLFGEGLVAGSVAKLAHVFWGTKDKLAALAIALKPSGFELGEQTPVPNVSDAYELVAVRAQAMSIADINQLTVALAKLASNQNVTYNGWQLASDKKIQALPKVVLGGSESVQSKKSQ